MNKLIILIKMNDDYSHKFSSDEIDNSFQMEEKMLPSVKKSTTSKKSMPAKKFKEDDTRAAQDSIKDLEDMRHTTS